MTTLDEFRGERAGAAADGLVAIVRELMRVGAMGAGSGRFRVPGVVTDLLEALMAESSTAPASGSDADPADTLGAGTWLVPAKAAELVGRDPSRVRQLCSSGRVRCRRPDKRTLLVDIDDLRRELSETGSRRDDIE